MFNLGIKCGNAGIAKKCEYCPNLFGSTECSNDCEWNRNGKCQSNGKSNTFHRLV